MIPARSSLVTVLALLAPALVRAQTFNGTVTYQVNKEETGREATVVQTTSGKRMRQDFDDGQGMKGSMIVDGETGTITTVMDQQKMYMVLTRNDAERMGPATSAMADAFKRFAPKDSNSAKPQTTGHFAKTGRTDTVAGERCEIWTYEGTRNGKTERGEACLSKSVGIFMTGMGGGMMGPRARASSSQNPVAELIAQGYGLLRASKDVNGHLVPMIEVTSIQRGTVPESKFQPPADYQRMDMGSMMRGRSQRKE